MTGVGPDDVTPPPRRGRWPASLRSLEAEKEALINEIKKHLKEMAIDEGRKVQLRQMKGAIEGGLYPEFTAEKIAAMRRSLVAQRTWARRQARKARRRDELRPARPAEHRVSESDVPPRGGEPLTSEIAARLFAEYFGEEVVFISELPNGSMGKVTAYTSPLVSSLPFGTYVVQPLHRGWVITAKSGRQSLVAIGPDGPSDFIFSIGRHGVW